MSMLFNAKFYLKNNADVFEASIGQPGAEFALNHYQNFGFKEFRDPNKDFNTKFYLTENQDVADGGFNPLDHFLDFGAKEGRTPNATFTTKATFDTAAYAAANSDLKKAGITSVDDLYAHFAKFGYDEVRTGMQTKDGVAISDGTTAVKVGSTFTLTSGKDTIVGDAAANTIDATGEVSGGVRLNSLNNNDSIDAKGGTDTLNYFARSAAVTPLSVKGIEVLNIQNIQGNPAATILSLIKGDALLETINSSNGVGGITTVSNIQGKIKTLDISTTAVGTTVSILNTALSGTTDALALNLNGVTAGVISVGGTIVGSGYETINIAIKGPASTVTLTDGVSNSLATVNVAGASALSLTLTDTTVTKINASTVTGAFTLNVAAGSGAQTITGGTVNDVINMAGTYTSADTIDGGKGSDRLTLTNAEAVAATTVQTLITNVETIGLNDGLSGTISLVNLGVDGLRLGATSVGAGTLNYATGTTNTLDLQNFASANFALTVNVAGTATTDALAMTVGSSAAGNTYGNGTVTINGAETVNLVSQGGANTFGTGAFTVTGTGLETLNITGSQNIRFNGAVVVDQVNASGMTGTAVLNMAAGAGTTAIVVTGTKNADVITGSTLGDTLTGGAGNDTLQNSVNLTVATSNDVINTGDGNDTVVLIGSNAIAGAGSTQINSATRVTDFDDVGTDILALSSNAGNYAGATAFQATGVTAAGLTVIQSVVARANATAINLTNGADLLKFTTAGAITGAAVTIQTAFNTAIGLTTVTGLGNNGDDMFFTIFDTTSNRMVIGIVDSGVNTTIETADVVHIVGTMNMTAAEYTAFNTADFAMLA